MASLSSLFPESDTEYVSFDGGIRLKARRYTPDRYRFFNGDRLAGRTTIARGAGLSYVAASFGAGATTIEHRLLNRILDFDPETRIVRVEAGASLGELYSFLAPRGLFLPVQPGHPNITVGGCTATDAHGKGHARYGTFSSQVRGLTLFHPRHGMIELSREKDADILELTCGGHGLTGNILHVDLEAHPIPASLETSVLPLSSLAQLPSALAAAEREWEYVYSWHDLVNGYPLGAGGHLHVARSSSLAERAITDPLTRPSSLDAETRRRLHFPMFGRPTARLVNVVHRRALAAAAAAGPRPISPYAFQFPIRRLELYFLLFGSRGFFEHQVLVPEVAFPEWVEKLHGRLRSHPFPVTLGSGKLFRGSRRLLRFSGNGICFAINVPRRRGADAFLTFLDKLALSTGGVPNIIKDSRLPQSVVADTYEEYDHFRERRADFDPHRLCRSELSERLGL